MVPSGAATRRPLVAMEIKDGHDISNAHNRAGEAEKSHLKAKERGYQERWTIMVMRGLDWNQISAETPSSTEVFDATEVRQRSGTSWENLKRKLSAVVGIPTP